MNDLKQMKVSVPVRWTHSEEHWGRITHVTLATTDYSLSPEQTQLCAINRLLYNTQWHLCLIDECLCYVRLPASCNPLGYTPGPTHIQYVWQISHTFHRVGNLCWIKWKHTMVFVSWHTDLKEPLGIFMFLLSSTLCSCW